METILSTLHKNPKNFHCKGMNKRMETRVNIIPKYKLSNTSSYRNSIDIDLLRQNCLSPNHYSLIMLSLTNFFK